MATFIQPSEEPIRVTARGDWLHGSERIAPKITALFSRNVAVQKDGSYAIRLGAQTHRIEVDDTPFIVRSIDDLSPSSAELTLVTSDGRTEQLDPATLMQSKDHVLYCRVERDGFSVPCRFLPSDYHNLALCAEPDGDSFALRVGGHKYRIGPYDQRPKKLN